MPKPKRKTEVSYLLQIIELCRMVGRKGTDPFEVEVKGILEKLGGHLPSWRLPEEFVLDAEAVSELAEIIKLQADWVKHRSSSLYVDSLFVALKIRILDPEAFVRIFLKAWHPIVAVEQFSQERLRAAIDYWNQLLPMDERVWGLPARTIPLGFIDQNDLFRLKLLSEEGFNEVLEAHWKELIERAGEKGEIPYWNFIYAEDYETTVFRAYLTSFLVTYGYATLKIQPIKNEVFIVPFKEPVPSIPGRQGFTVPIPIDYETWRKFKEARNESGG